jgi:hypothetical protein
MSERILHVLNGDATRVPLQQSGVPGECLVWVDVFHHGPVPAGLPDDEFRRLRARHLSAESEDETDLLDALRRRDAHLDRYREYDEVIFWFEHDLFDQLLLVRHLHWLAAQPPWPGFRLICIDSFPGHTHFNGLGELSPYELARLFPTRWSITPEEVALGAAWWDAFRAADPRRFARMVLAENTRALPQTAGAFRRMLEEFPGAADGLSRSQRQIVRAAASGATSAVDLFRTSAAMEERVFMGDMTFWRILRGLTEGVVPLFAHDGTFHANAPPSGIFTLTPAGDDVLDARVDYIDLNGIDTWIGGVHLTDGRYRWTGMALEIR